MLTIRLAETQDQACWNEYVKQHSEASPYHLYAWRQSIEQAYRHKGIYLIAEENEHIVGVLPSILMSPPLFSNKLCCLPFCDMGKPLCNSLSIKQNLIQHALKLSQQHQCKAIELREEDTETLSHSPKPGNKVRMKLALPTDSEALWSSFKSKLRSQVRKAEKNGLTYEIGHSIEQLQAFYQVYAFNMKRLGSPAHAYHWFEAILEHYQNHCMIVLVKMSSQTIGAGLVLTVGKKASIPWASTLSNYNKYAPNMLLYWATLKQVTDTGIQEFDFGRSTLGEGTYKFKEQWGAQPYLLNWKTLNTQGKAFQMQNTNSKLRPMVEAIWRKLPLGLTNTLGPQLRRYISL